MVKVFKETEQEFYLNGFLQTNLDTAKRVIKKDWDMVFLVDGSEGSGKSTIAIQAGFYCDPTLNIDKIVFTPKEFQTAILKAGKYETVIYDEAYTGLSSRATMSRINKTLVSMLAEIRQKNLFVFVVMPTFFDLDKYVALWRSRALLHVYTGDNFKRGYFAFYNADRKKDLYVNGKKYYNYYKPKPNFIGDFTSKLPVDKELYKEKKKKSLEEKDKDDKDDMEEMYRLAKMSKDIAFMVMYKYWEKNPNALQQKLITDITGYTSPYFRAKIKQLKKKGGVFELLNN